MTTTPDSRIAPPVPPPTSLKIARNYGKSVPPSGDEADSNLRDLLKQIDNSHTIFVHHNHPIFTESGQAVTPGRYRLVRDDQ